MSSQALTVAQHAIGWHGKLPTVGDFVTRRLDNNFVAIWDEWLSANLASLRASEPDGWLDAYLASPTWRFVLTPGFLPPPLHREVWAGILMPSVDRVGRYYPLTLAAPLRAVPASVEGQKVLWSWLQQLQDAAIDALQDDWSIDALETELLRLGLPPEPALTYQAPVLTTSGLGEASMPASMESFFALCSPDALLAAGRGKCVWYNEADVSAPRMVCSRGMDRSVVQLLKA